MATVTIDDVRSQLLTLDQVREVLGQTEPLAVHPFDAGTDVRFGLDAGWNHGLDELGGDEKVRAAVRFGDQTYQLTKRATMQAAKLAFISPQAVEKTPARLIEQQLNYWFREGFGDREFALTTLGGVGRAVLKTVESPFSNLRLLDSVLVGLRERYGNDTEILADYKLAHALDGTWVRLIVPEQFRLIRDSGTEDDAWSVGVQFTNSVFGPIKTEISGYLFRYWCANGAIDTHATSGAWSNKVGDRADVWDWAREAVDGVLGGLELALAKVQELTSIRLQEHTDDVLRDLFDRYKIPAAPRDDIIDQMINDDTLTMYSVMNAVTSAANVDGLAPKTVDRLLRAGGNLPHVAHKHCDSCKRLLGR